jgi:2-polyprenyl-3-methyl-5-hydroxy-6-metoxy-1,4-benzoquinol methylase
MQEQGHRVENYDPFYAPDVGLLLHKYDFIILTEVIEHLRDPALELVRLWDCLNPGGYLAVMTQMTDDVEDFGSWYYQRDPTHICFWSRDTMIWLSKNLSGAQLSFPGSSLAFLQKATVEFD